MYQERLKGLQIQVPRRHIIPFLLLFLDADDTTTQKRDITDKEKLKTDENSPLLPTNMKITSETDTSSCHPKVESNLLSMQIDVKTYFTWTAANALIINRCSPMKKIGFLPAILDSVINYSTVYSSLRNFEEMRNQLNHQSFSR